MGLGFFKAEVHTDDGALPVAGAAVKILCDGEKLHNLETNEHGLTQIVELPAPPKDNSLDSAHPGPFYNTYDVIISKLGFITVEVRRVQVYDTITSILPVRMTPEIEGEENPPRIIELPKLAIEMDREWRQQGPMIQPVNPREVCMPESVTVHMGAHDEQSHTVSMGFKDYIKRVAASGIFPTWPAEALEANICCAITFTLNRIHTGWYRNRGYDFDITCCPETDQAFDEGRNTFANMDAIIDKVFNRYVRKSGHSEPYFTDFCNGSTVTCPGMSQWGTLTLANHGMNALDILRFYYPRDIEIVECAEAHQADEAMPVSLPGTSADRESVPPFPGVELSIGLMSDSIWMIQDCLNAISTKYPSIPTLEVDGIFSTATENAVLAYQKLFGLVPNGIVGFETWGSIMEVCSQIQPLAYL